MPQKTNVLETSYTRTKHIQSGIITGVTAADTVVTPFRNSVDQLFATKVSDGSFVALTIALSTGTVTVGTGPSNESVRFFIYGRF